MENIADPQADTNSIIKYVREINDNIDCIKNIDEIQTLIYEKYLGNVFHNYAFVHPIINAAIRDFYAKANSYIVEKKVPLSRQIHFYDSFNILSDHRYYFIYMLMSDGCVDNVNVHGQYLDIDRAHKLFESFINNTLDKSNADDVFISSILILFANDMTNHIFKLIETISEFFDDATFIKFCDGLCSTIAQCNYRINLARNINIKISLKYGEKSVPTILNILDKIRDKILINRFDMDIDRYLLHITAENFGTPIENINVKIVDKESIKNKRPAKSPDNLIEFI